VPGLHAVIVGYRHNDRRRWLIRDAVREVARCVDCGNPVWFTRSGQESYMERDPKVVCQDCWDVEAKHIKAEL
jgi:DNA-directed RNA polymerase subunit RPC12/RpoP